MLNKMKYSVKSLAKGETGRLFSGKNLLIISLLLATFYLLPSTSLHAQTTYTWTGTTNTAWTTTTNWSPNGVPDSLSTIIISSQTNTPTLSADVYIRQLTLNSGTLSLAGYTMEVEQNISILGGTITAGKLYARQTRQYSDVLIIKDATINCKVDIRTPNATLTGCTYNDSLRIDQWGGWAKSAGNNIFNGHLHFVQSGGPITLGGTLGPDSVMSTCLVEMESTASNKWWFAGGQGVYYGDDVTIRNRTSNRDVESSGAAYFNGDLYLGVKSTFTGKTRIGNTNYPVTVSATHTIKVDTMGFGGGTLYLYEVTQNGSAAMDLSTVAAIVEIKNSTLGGKLTTSTTDNLKIMQGNTFGAVDLGKVVTWYGTTFLGKAEILATGSTGGNVFHDTTDVTVNTGGLLMGYYDPDTSLAPFTFTHNGTSDSYLNFKKAGSYFADDITITNSNASNKWVYVGYTTASTTTYDGDIFLNQTNGIGIYFKGGGNTVNGGVSVGTAGITTGKLYFSNIVQTTSDSIVLTNIPATSYVSFSSSNCVFNGHVRLEGGLPYMYLATFNGGASVTAESIPPTYCHFGADTYFTKTGGTNNLTKANYYGGDLTVTNESNSNYLYLGYILTDTVMGDVTLVNNGNALLWFASTTKTPIHGDLTLDGNGEIKLGHWGPGDYLSFEGSGHQTVTIGDSVTHTVYRMLIDKPTGDVVLKDSLIIDDELNFDQGRVVCQADGILTLHDGGTVADVSDDMYVEGPVKKVGNDAFTFPVGRNGLYRPIVITAPTATTDEFTAEYFEKNSDPLYDHSSKDTTLNYLSTNEYWTLEHGVGTSTPTVTLVWDSITSCTMDTPLTDIHVAGWSVTNSKWADLGNGSTTGGITEGTVSTASGVSEFTAFVLGTDSAMGCHDCNSGGALANDSCVAISATEGDNWFRFMADTTIMVIIAQGYDEDDLPFADSMAVFASCHETYTLAETIYDSSMSSNILTIDSLTVGHEYWVNCVRSDTGNTQGSICVYRGWGLPPPTNLDPPCEYVPNSGFESHLANTAPFPCGKLELGGEPIVDNWLAAAWTPDIYNAECDCPNVGTGGNPIGVGVHGIALPGGGIAPASNGGGTYAGVNVFRDTPQDNREYIGNMLAEPLIQDRCYRLSVLVALRVGKRNCPDAWPGCGDPKAIYEVNSFGALITNTPLVFNNGPQTLPSNGPTCTGNELYHLADPTDATTVINNTTQWEERVVFFTASGNEDRIYLGNFCTDTETGDPDVVSEFETCQSGANRARVLFDNVSIIDVGFAGFFEDKICLGESVILGCEDLTADGVTYAWTPATGLSCTDCPNPVATPLVTTTYTLTVTITLPDGTTTSECTDDVSIGVRQCCLEDLTHVPPNVNVSDLETLGYVTGGILNTELVFEGDLTIEQDLTFEGASGNMLNIWMYPDANIDVEDGIEMTTNFTIFDAACNKVWNRIRVPDAASAITMDQSILRNAERGLVAVNGCDVILQDNTFEFNMSHLRFTDGNYNGLIEGNVFRCSDGAGSNLNPNPYWGGVPGILPNAAGQLRTNTSIIINNSTVIFGSNTTGFDQNLIMDGHHGIDGIDHILRCYNTRFENIVQNDANGLNLQSYNNRAFCIRRRETNGTPITGDGMTVNKCEFVNSDFGIRGMRLGRAVEITGNLFNNIASPSQLEDAPFCSTDPRSAGTAIWCNNCDLDNTGTCVGVQYVVSDNEFIDASHGIRLLNIENGHIQIEDNSMVWNNIDNNELRGSGILIDNTVANTNLNLTIKDNTFTDALLGMHIRHMNGTDPDYDVGIDVFIESNNIILHQPDHAAGLCWVPYTGIMLESVVNATVATNDIHGPTNYGYTWDWTANGVRSFNTHLTDYYCNDLHRLGNGIHLIAANDASQMVTNEMWDLRTGFLFNEAVTGDQGSTDEGNGNSWSGGNWPTSQTGSSPFHIGAYSPSMSWNGLNSAFYIAITSPSYFPDNLDNNIPNGGVLNNPIVISTATLGGGVGLDVCHEIEYPRSALSVGRRDTIYLSLIKNDTVPSGLQDSTLYWSKYFGLYSILLNDTAVTNMDTVLSNLRDSLQTSTVGLAYRSILALGDSSLNTTLLSSYSDSLSKDSTFYFAEELLVNHLEWLTNLRANDDTLVAGDVSDLMDLADDCLFTSGMVVTMARSMLSTLDSLSHKEWVNDCELLTDTTGGGARMSGSEAQEDEDQVYVLTKHSVQVFPNPSSGTVIVILPETPEFEWSYSLHSVAGVEFYSGTLTKQRQVISFVDVATGLYYLSISDQSREQQFSDKLLIIRP